MDPSVWITYGGCIRMMLIEGAMHVDGVGGMHYFSTIDDGWPPLRAMSWLWGTSRVMGWSACGTRRAGSASRPSRWGGGVWGGYDGARVWIRDGVGHDELAAQADLQYGAAIVDKDARMRGTVQALAPISCESIKCMDSSTCTCGSIQT